VELAPKGTGKSYIFGNTSKYGWLISGGTVSRAKLFYDVSKNTMGIITMYYFITIDEIQTIRFTDENELRGALKNYLESGFFTVANVRQTSSAGLMLLEIFH
jgi:ATP-dependent Lon protease